MAHVRNEMEGRISELMEQIQKHHEAESELLKENNLLKEKLAKEREEFLPELSRENSSKQDLLERLEAKIQEQEREKQELQEALRKETEELRLAQEKELKEVEEQKRLHELKLKQNLKSIIIYHKKMLQQKVEETEQRKRETEEQLNQKIEQLQKLSEEEKIKVKQLRREVELASIAAARNQQEAEQSSEVITSLQDQLDKQVIENCDDLTASAESLKKLMFDIQNAKQECGHNDTFMDKLAIDEYIDTRTDSNSHLNNKGDVDGINFRPSSNNKHMRKYRQGAVAGEAGGGETPGTRSEEDSAGECQPPLSRDPPPPDSPLLTLKMEVKDEDYQESDEQSSSDLSLDNSNPKRKMCRDFARGACPYGDKCRFAHEIIVSQLPGVYTFCKDFQNSICKYQGQCKFGHATVFEKELFFRTGYLPPHAIAHMQPAEAPGPSAPPTEGGLAEAAAVYHSCPIPGGPVVHPGVSGVAGGGAEARPSADALAATAAIPAFPREWRDMDDLGAAAAREAARPAEPKKCRFCDITMYRYQCAKNRLEKAQRSSQELEKKKAALAVKLAKQRLILNAIQALESSGLPVAGPSTRREVELASIAAARNQQEAEQSSEVITSLQDQLDKDVDLTSSPVQPPRSRPARVASEVVDLTSLQVSLSDAPPTHN